MHEFRVWLRSHNLGWEELWILWRGRVDDMSGLQGADGCADSACAGSKTHRAEVR